MGFEVERHDLWRVRNGRGEDDNGLPAYAVATRVRHRYGACHSDWFRPVRSRAVEKVDGGGIGSLGRGEVLMDAAGRQTGFGLPA